MNGQITSPEQLNGYIRVTNPGVWTVLAAIIVLLAGAFFWLFTGSIEKSETFAAYTESDLSLAFIPVETASQIAPGMTARVGGAKGVVSKISAQAMTYDEMSRFVGEDALRVMRITGTERLCMVSISSDNAPKGVSRAEVIFEVIRPVYFLLR